MSVWLYMSNRCLTSLSYLTYLGTYGDGFPNLPYPSKAVGDLVLDELDALCYAI